MTGAGPRALPWGMGEILIDSEGLPRDLLARCNVESNSNHAHAG